MLHPALSGDPTEQEPENRGQRSNKGDKKGKRRAGQGGHRDMKGVGNEARGRWSNDERWEEGGKGGNETEIWERKRQGDAKP